MKLARLLITAVSLGLGLSAFAGTPPPLQCEKGKIRIHFVDAPDRVEDAEYCYSLEPWVLISKDCYSSKTCALKTLAEQHPVDAMKLYHGVGTPGSLACQSIGGKAQVIEFSAQGKWEKLNRCLTGHSFADLATVQEWAAP